MDQFGQVTDGVETLLKEWESKLGSLSNKVISERRNSQHRTIKQILGHMVDSASNNIHRIIHLQYQESPLQFPNYASYGNNDRWITIQNYQEENWDILVQMWKYSNLHFIHVVKNVDLTKLDNKWEHDTGKFITLRDNINDYLRHFKLHMTEIDELIKKC